MPAWYKIRKVYIWPTEIRPNIPTIDFLLVAWGWAWGRGLCRAWGWGGAWWVIYCQDLEMCKWNYAVVVWAWATWGNTTAQWANWCNSCFDSYVAYWWGWGWGMSSSTSGCVWKDWGSGWGWAGCCKVAGVGCTWQWNGWWCWGTCSWWWGGWYCVVWGAWTTARAWWIWWCWFNSNISGDTVWYSNWGSWWGCTWWAATYGWGKWWWSSTAWSDATTYWSWWWGWGCNTWGSCTSWGSGCQWIFIARYPCTKNFNISWWCKYLCNWYCIHCFTSNWTLTIS